MKRVYVNEEWCLGCHLCEYNCVFANSGKTDFVKAIRSSAFRPRIRIENSGTVYFAVSCRHCTDPLCMKSCITGALRSADGVIRIDRNQCVGCYTCVLVCPYGCIMPGEADGRGAHHVPVQKCELCVNNLAVGCEPACVQGCPNRAIVFEERPDSGEGEKEAAV